MGEGGGGEGVLPSGDSSLGGGPSFQKAHLANEKDTAWNSGIARGAPTHPRSREV